MTSHFNRLLTPILLVVSLCLIAITTNAQEQPVTATDKKVVKLINNLPEVMDANKYIYRTTHGQRDLKTYIERSPTAAQPYYVVSVREFNGMNLVPHFWFYVDPKTFDIRYWDVAEDKSIPLKQWQKHVREVKRKRAG